MQASVELQGISEEDVEVKVQSNCSWYCNIDGSYHNQATASYEYERGVEEFPIDGNSRKV